MTAYAVPENPADPEAAALDLIVRLPGDVLEQYSRAREAFQDFAGLLSAEGVFAGMSWHDAKHAATAIIIDAITRDDAAEFLSRRAAMTSAGADNMEWDDRDAMVRALTIAAKVLAI